VCPDVEMCCVRDDRMRHQELEFGSGFMTSFGSRERLSALVIGAFDLLPDFGPPVWSIFRAGAHGGWDAPEPFMSDIGGLLPIAL